MAENNDKKAVTLSQLERVADALISKVEQFAIPDSSIEVDHLSENVIELINQNSFVLEDKSIEAKHLSEEIVNLLNKDCSISEEDYNSFVSFDVNELVFSIIRKPLYTVTYDATEDCVAHFTVVCDMSKIANYKTIDLNMKVFNWSGPNRQQVAGGGTFSSNVIDLDGSYVNSCSYLGTPVINGDIIDGEGTLTGSIAPIMSADALSKPYAKLAFTFTKLKVGQPISFDIDDISLTIDGEPLEILNFGGFFSKEGCTVISHAEESDEPEESTVLYNVEYTPTSERQVINFAVVMNESDYVVGSTIDFSMDIDNWDGQDKTNITIGGGIYTSDTTALNGSFNEVSDVTTLLLDGTLVDGKGTLSATFNAESIPSGSYVILSFSLTTIDLGNTVTFDINDISLKVDNNPVEILNLGGFFPGEGCTVVKVN